MNKEGFIKYLESKNFTQRTLKEQILIVNLFFIWVQKEDIQITKPDILKYLEYLKNKGLQNSTRQNHLVALNNYFTFLYQEEIIVQNPCLFLKIRGTNKKKLYKIYTPEELEQLFDNYYQLFVRNFDNNNYRCEVLKQYAILGRERNALMLSLLINQGIKTSEIEKIRLNDLDIMKATLKIGGGKKLNSRVFPLKATQIGMFVNYLQNIRPKIVQCNSKESDKLFLSLPTGTKNKTGEHTLKATCLVITRKIKSIDKQFVDFLQVRASVISYWIKTEGLRKAQYLAGHRHIHATEYYVANNLDDLTEDINKLNPFDF
jgi:site-specific recombinase XerD